VVKVTVDAFQVILKCGKAPGVLIGDETVAKHFADNGGLFVAVGADQNLLRDSATALASRFK
jgi:4-hydroxy-2-oxoheptanedioate aldolase